MYQGEANTAKRQNDKSQTPNAQGVGEMKGIVLVLIVIKGWTMSNDSSRKLMKYGRTMTMRNQGI